MATLVDHKRRTRTEGTVESLEQLMVNGLIGATKHKPRDLGRYCASSVRAAIRRGGRTDAGQELEMSETERAAWELANPLPE